MTDTLRKELVQRIVRNLLDVQILKLIQRQPMWGYRIKQKVAVDFGVTLRHGALYPLLIKLEQNGFLASQEQLQGGRTRKVYSITEKGNDYLKTYDEVIREQLG